MKRMEGGKEGESGDVRSPDSYRRSGRAGQARRVRHYVKAKAKGKGDFARSITLLLSEQSPLDRSGA